MVNHAKVIGLANDEMNQRRIGRLNRAYDVMKSMIEGSSRHTKAKQDLISILPSIIDPELCGKEISQSKSQKANSNYDSDAVTVTRKSSFSVKLDEGDLQQVRRVAKAVSTSLPNKKFYKKCNANKGNDSLVFKGIKFSVLSKKAFFWEWQAKMNLLLLFILLNPMWRFK